jgi:hypothetical protein
MPQVQTYLRLRRSHRAVVEIIQDFVVGFVLLLTIFLTFSFCSFRSGREVFGLVAAVVDSFVLPLLTSIVSITFSIVIDNKVIFVEATSHDLFVAILVDLVVDGT